MAIQLRRGAYANFDPAKMTPGEPAIVVSGDPNSSDGKSAYVAFAAGDVKRLATHDDMVAEIADITEDIINEVSTEIEEAIHDDMETASEAAATATQKASDASASAAEAAQTVATIIDPTLSQTGKAADAKATGDAISDLNGALSDVKEDFILQMDEIPDTIQSYTFADGTVSQITHSRSGMTIRTDAFTYGADTITEVRTSSTGTLTIVTNLTTLETTVTYVAA